MYRNELPGAPRHRYSFESPVSDVSPFRVRRPTPFPRRRIATNRFQTQIHRPFSAKPPLLNSPSNRMNSNFRPRPFAPQNVNRPPMPRFQHDPLRPVGPPGLASEADSAMLPNFNPTPSFMPPLTNTDKLWIETVSPDGRPYFYHAVSRVVSWDRPENAQVVNLNRMRSLPECMLSSPTVTNSADIAINPVMPALTQHPQMPTALYTPPRYFVGPPPNFCTPPPFFPSLATNSVLNFSEYPPKTTSEVPNQHSPVPTYTQDIQVLQHSEDKGVPASSASKEEETECQQATTDCNNEEARGYTNLENSEVNESREVDNSTEAIEMKSSDDQNHARDTNSTDLLDGTAKQESAGENQMETSTSPVDKSRPISSTPVFGSKWCVVWTGEHKVFFYNADLKLSVWELPDELSNRADVQKLMTTPPKISDNSKSSRVSEAKKMKIETESCASSVPQSTAIQINKDNSEEMILKAKKEREEIPHEKRVQMFLQLLQEKNVSAFSTWEKELHKIVFDYRYLLLGPKERKLKFESYVREKLHEERENRKREYQLIKDNFRNLLSEAGVTVKSKFSDFMHRNCKDPRFKAVEKTKEREILFGDYIKRLRKDSEIESRTGDKLVKNYLQLLREQDGLNKHSSWTEWKEKLYTDDRYLALDNNSERERLFREFIRNATPDDATYSKEDRIKASIKSRKKEVERELQSCLKERDKEQISHRNEVTINSFKALLLDLVRSPDVTWHEAKKTLKEDHRWADVHDLRYDIRQELFDEHLVHLHKKKKESFLQMLQESDIVTLKSTWKEVKRDIMEDPRCKQFSTDEWKCEKMFKLHIRDLMKRAKDEYKELLSETKLITHESKSFMKNSNHLDCIEKALEKDKRYLVLSCIEKERREILLNYIDKLHKRGAPPPPTASEASFR